MRELFHISGDYVLDELIWYYNLMDSIDRMICGECGNRLKAVNYQDNLAVLFEFSWSVNNFMVKDNPFYIKAITFYHDKVLEIFDPRKIQFKPLRVNLSKMQEMIDKANKEWGKPETEPCVLLEKSLLQVIVQTFKRCKGILKCDAEENQTA